MIEEFNFIHENKIWGNDFNSSFLFFYTSIISTYDGPDYINMYLTFILLSVIYLIKFIKNENIIYLFLSGIFIGCSFVFRFYEAGAGLAALFFSLLFYYYKYKKSINYSIKTLAIYTTGLIIVILALLLAFNNIISVMYREVIVQAVSNGTSMDLPYFHEVFTLLTVISTEFSKLIHEHNFASILYLVYHLIKLFPTILYYLIPFISVVYIIIFIASHPAKDLLCISIVLFLWGIVSFPKGLGRSDIAHMAPSVTPLLFFLWYSSKNLITNVENKTKNRIMKLISKPVLIIMMLTFIYPVFNAVSMVKKPNFYIKTAHGLIPTKSKQEHDDVVEVLNFIEQNTTKDDYIFVTPWSSPPLYALTDRKDPTYYDSMNDLIVRPSAEHQLKLCNDLKTHNTKVIIHNPDWGYDNKPEQYFKTACSIINNYIIDNYNLVKKNSNFLMYMRK